MNEVASRTTSNNLLSRIEGHKQNYKKAVSQPEGVVKVVFNLCNRHANNVLAFININVIHVNAKTTKYVS